MNRLLIVGATGVLGSAATKYFLHKKISVKAFVRNKDKAITLEKAGAGIFVGDITNTSSIAEACKDVDVIIATLHGMLSRGKNKSQLVDDRGHKNLIDAAVKAGAKHFIYSSVFGAAKDHPIDFFRTKYAIEQYLINSGLPYTILRLPAFMEWHVHNLLGKSILEKGKTTIFGKGNNPTNFIAVDDIVQTLGLVLTSTEYYSQIIRIAGPENLSRNEVAQLYGKILNVTPRINHVPIPALKFLSYIINPFHPGIGRIMKLSIYGDRNDATMNTNDSIGQFGLQPTTVEAFIRKQVGLPGIPPLGNSLLQNSYRNGGIGMSVYSKKIYKPFCMIKEPTSTKAIYPGEGYGQLLHYWKQQLADAPKRLELHTDHPRSAVGTHPTANFQFTISKICSDAINLLSQQYDVSLIITLFSAFNTLLYRYTNQTDIVVGYFTNDDNISENGNSTKRNNNIIPLRTDLSGNPPFSELLQRVQEVVNNANEHKNLPLEVLEEALASKEDTGNSSLLQVMFALQNIPEVPQLHLGDVMPSPKRLPHNTTKFDIALLVTETANGLQGSLEYATDLYNESTINRMVTHFKELLGSIVKEPQQKIGELAMLTKAEEQQLLVDFNNTKVDYPKDKTIVDLFEEQAVRTPGATAVAFETEQLSYQQLNEKANRLAHYLRSRGVKEETLVPICVERSLEMIIGVLGILKAGGAYVPIDPEYPKERISYMLEDTGAAIMVTSKKSRSKLTTTGIEVIEIDADWKTINKQPTGNLQTDVQPHHLAYVIYTSGSTGKPKGVRMAGGGLVNLLAWQEKQFENRNRRVLQFASLNFDVSFQEIFSTLCFGSTLHLISEDNRRDPPKMIEDLGKHRITHLFIPYIVLKNLSEYILSLSYVSLSLEEIIVAGEQLKLTEDIQDFVKKSSVRLINQYGPTEAHVVSCYRVDSNFISAPLPPIGKPIDNTTLYILNERQALLPIGVAGELYIGGVQVARGYLNRVELTAGKFIKDIFSGEADARLYKTGDLARWLADGNIEYLGRIDDQVKIRGYRIELGEIESLLQQHEGVRQGVVLARADSSGNKRLVGYVVPEGSFNKESIITDLKSKLPDYMVPALWVELEGLPVTANGKIDRKALPDPDMDELLRNQYVAPRNKIEEKLSAIWQELLGVEKVGIYDNIFELGMNSLQAYKLFTKIKKITGIDLPISILFQKPTIELLAAYLQGKETNAPWSSLVPIQPNGSKLPLFCVHAGGGTVLFYHGLSKYLGADQPVYGLQPKGLDGKQKFQKTLEEMAEHYINEIRTINPEGPFLLGGYCFGGMAVFEMAQQLISQGFKVALLAIFNGVSPTYIEPSHNNAAHDDNENLSHSKENILSSRFSWKTLAQLSTKEKHLYLSKKIKGKTNVLLYQWKSKILYGFLGLALSIYKWYEKRGLIPPEILRKYYFFTLNANMVTAYKPKPYPGSMTIFRSPGIYPDPHLGWSDFVTGEIKTFDIPGDHADRRQIMDEPFVQDTAKELKMHIEEQK